MAAHDPIDRETCAAYLRSLASQVEAGHVDALWVVVSTAPRAPHVHGHMSLLGPTPDLDALAKLVFLLEQHKHLLFNSLNEDCAFEVANRQSGPREGGG